MARKKEFLKSDPMADLEAQINADFNSVVRKTHSSLSTKTHSPVWTGFFASSWREKKTKGRIFLQARQSPGFGQAGKSAGYSELNL
jgi:hypothetical protein